MADTITSRNQETEHVHNTIWMVLFKRFPEKKRAPEIFQRKTTETLQGLEGASVYMHGILVYGDTMEQHDQQLTKVLEIMSLLC